MVEVPVGLGSNLGNRAWHLEEALRQLAALGEVARVSSYWETEPVGYTEQGRFLNAAALVRTELEPRVFLEGLQAIEKALGRMRAMRNGPRTIDLDILLWGDKVIQEAGLEIPHPRMHERLFVLGPLSEIAPQARHPLLGRTVEELRRGLS